MKLWSLALSALLAGSSGALSQPSQHAEGEEEVELYVLAVKALLGTPDASGRFYVASWLRSEGGRLQASPVPEAVVERLAGAGYGAELAELAENGLWHVPRGALFIVLHRIEFWPGHKIALFSLDVGSGPSEEVKFKFRREEGERGAAWVLIEKGPAENEG